MWVLYAAKNHSPKCKVSNWKVVGMKKEELAPGIVLVRDVIPGYEQLIPYIEGSVMQGIVDWEKADVRSYEDNERSTNTSVRDTHIIGIPHNYNYQDPNIPELSFEDRMNSIFTMFFSQYEYDYVRDYRVLMTKHEAYSILRYQKDQHFAEHTDDHPERLRRFSTVYYMNDNYSGGELEFPRFGLKIKPEANSMLIFPSNHVYNHIVHPVSDGVRYAVASFVG